MRRPFNFHQGAGWGILPTGEYDFSQLQIDFFTGLYLPGAVEAGKGAGFTWNNYQTAYLDTVIPSGGITHGNRDTPSLRSRFEGGLYNLFKDSGNLFTSFSSGDIPSNNIDRVPFSIIFSPKFSGASMSSGNIFVSWSGDISSGNKDIVSFSNNFSGGISGIQFDSGNLNITFRGSFTSPDRDYISSVSFALTGAIYQDDLLDYTTETFQTGANISMQLYGVFYDNY